MILNELKKKAVEFDEMKARMAQFESILKKLAASTPAQENPGATATGFVNSNAGVPVLQQK